MTAPVMSPPEPTKNNSQTSHKLLLKTPQKLVTSDKVKYLSTQGNASFNGILSSSSRIQINGSNIINNNSNNSISSTDIDWSNLSRKQHQQATTSYLCASSASDHNVTAAGSGTVSPTDMSPTSSPRNDDELTSLSWLQDSNLLKSEYQVENISEY